MKGFLGVEFFSSLNFDIQKAWTDQVYPMPVLNLTDLNSGWLSWSQGSVILADIGSLQMEFCTLSYLTKNPKYCKKVLPIIDFIQSVSDADGLCRPYINYKKANPYSRMTIGGLSDSYYEAITLISSFF